MFDWMRDIVGDTYTNDMDSKVAAAIGKRFVAKADFDEKNEDLKKAQRALAVRDGPGAVDVAALQAQIETLRSANTATESKYKAELQRLQVDHVVERELTAAKARNLTAARALLSDFLEKAKLGEGGTVQGLTEEIQRLAQDETTSFLFDAPAAPQQPTIKGATPLGGASGAPDGKTSEYGALLNQAREKGDTLAAIKIKQDAAAEGIVLM